MKHPYRKLSFFLAFLMLALTACTPTPSLRDDQGALPPSEGTTDDTSTATPETKPEPGQTPEQNLTQNGTEDTRSAVEKMTDQEIDDLVNDHPGLLARYSDTERMAILRRYIDKQLENKAPTAVLSDMSFDPYFAFCVGSEEDRFGFRNYYLLSSHQTPTPGEPKYLVLEYSVTGKLIGTTVLLAEEELTLPDSSNAYFAVNNSLERLNIILEEIAPTDPLGYLREAWADDYLGTRDGVDYYVTHRLGTKDGLEVYDIMGLQRTMEQSPLVKRAPATGGQVKTKAGVLPIAATTPATVAAQSEERRLMYLQDLAAEQGYFAFSPSMTLRQRAACYWGSFMIGAEADRDYYALQPITDRDRYNGTQVDALVVVYHDDGSVADVQLTQMSTAPYGDAQTLADVILAQSPYYSSNTRNDAYLLWLESFTQVLGYDGTSARTLIREALGAYYDRTEEPRSYTAVDFFLLPGVEGEDPVQLWIEYNYTFDRMERIRIGKFILNDVEF